MKETLKLQPPWYELHEQFKALFGQDPEISVDFDSGKLKIALRVESAKKAAALDRLIPMSYPMGGRDLSVSVVPGNKVGDLLPEDAEKVDVVAAAFDGNPVVKQVRRVSKGMFKDLVYCVFRKEVVQYPNDNLGDVNGNKSTLMECIARELMPVKDVFFCTSAVGGLQGGESAACDAPLGEWP